jgi:hypothetical protein
VSILDIYIFSVYIQYMNSTLTRIVVTMKNGVIGPTASTQKLGTLPLMTYKIVDGSFIYKYGTWGGQKNQPLYRSGITLTVDGVEVGTGAYCVMIKDAVEAWAKSHGAERVSVTIQP